MDIRTYLLSPSRSRYSCLAQYKQGRSLLFCDDYKIHIFKFHRRTISVKVKGKVSSPNFCGMWWGGGRSCCGGKWWRSRCSGGAVRLGGGGEPGGGGGGGSASHSGTWSGCDAGHGHAHPIRFPPLLRCIRKTTIDCAQNNLQRPLWQSVKINKVPHCNDVH